MCSPDGGTESQYLGGIDPTLYKTSGSSAADDDDEENDDEGLDQVEGGRGLGSVRFGVSYERETERLTVTLVRARHLPSRNPGTGNACDPFVRLDRQYTGKLTGSRFSRDLRSF